MCCCAVLQAAYPVRLRAESLMIGYLRRWFVVRSPEFQGVLAKLADAQRELDFLRRVTMADPMPCPVCPNCGAYYFAESQRCASCGWTQADEAELLRLRTEIDADWDDEADADEPTDTELHVDPPGGSD